MMSKKFLLFINDVPLIMIPAVIVRVKSLLRIKILEELLHSFTSMLNDGKLVHPVHERVAFFDHALEVAPDAGDEFVACE